MASRLWVVGINQETFEKQFISQEGKCQICGVPISLTGRETHADHDHDTGKFRAILCFKCNLGLGYFREDINILASAISYLSVHKGGKAP